MEKIQGLMACMLSHPDLGSRVGPWHPTLGSYALYTHNRVEAASKMIEIYVILFPQAHELCN